MWALRAAGARGPRPLRACTPPAARTAAALAGGGRAGGRRGKPGEAFVSREEDPRAQCPALQRRTARPSWSVTAGGCPAPTPEVSCPDSGRRPGCLVVLGCSTELSCRGQARASHGPVSVTAEEGPVTPSAGRDSGRRHEGRRVPLGGYVRPAVGTAVAPAARK